MVFVLVSLFVSLLPVLGDGVSSAGIKTKLHIWANILPQERHNSLENNSCIVKEITHTSILSPI